MPPCPTGSTNRNRPPISAPAPLAMTTMVACLYIFATYTKLRGVCATGVAERGAPQVREAELRLRGPGSPGPRAAVEADEDRGRPDAGGAPETGAGAGQGPAGGGGVRAVPGPGRAGEGGERGDLRGPPGRAGRPRRHELRPRLNEHRPLMIQPAM